MSSMTSLKHEKAFPKSFQTEIALTPEEAKSLYPYKIRSNRDFICATANCSAPLTCRCIDSLKTSSFVEGRRSENLHADHCPFSNRTVQKVEPTFQDQQFEVTDTGKNVDHTKGLYFDPILDDEEATPIKTSESMSTEDSPLLIIETTERDDLAQRLHNNRMTKLQHFVFHFEEDSEGTFINKQNIELPIRSRFRHIRTFQEPLPEDDRFIIVYGHAHLFKVNHPFCYQIRFDDIIEINNRYIHPTFLISQEWIQQNYSFLLPRKDKPTPFMAYIRKFPVLVQSKFINFKFEEEYSHKLGYFISPEEQMKGNTYFTPIPQI